MSESAASMGSSPNTASRTAVAAVDRVRRSLAGIVWARALLMGVITATAVLLLGKLVLLAGAPRADLPLLRVSWLAAAAGTLVVGARRWRDGPIDQARAALWVEEQESQAFAVVTAVEPQRAEVLQLLEPRLRGVPWSAVTTDAARRALLFPAFGVILLIGLLAILPSHDSLLLAREAARSGQGVGRPTPAGPATVSVGAVAVLVRPPAYSGLPPRTERDPESVSVLAGSSVTLSGSTRGDLGAVDGTTNLPVNRDGDAWSVTLTMPERPVVARLTSSGEDRLVLLTPVIDSTPVVTLADAVRDTVLREAAGAIALAADARDDLGLVSGGFEYIVSSGEGELFTSRSDTVGRVALGGARRASLTATLQLDRLQLGPGDIVHVRAIARDGNILSGPGVGSSETRTIRIARPGEYDSLSVEGVPPSAGDTAALSQRMLLIQTERLERDRPRIPRDSLLARAGRISSDQTRLRKRVGELVYARLGDDVDGEHSHFPGDGHDHGAEGKLDPADILARASAATGSGEPVALDFHGDETPVVAMNKPLLEAYNHMWDATRALDIGEPAGAIPPMRLALAALQRARQAERIYLRGRPPRVVVDVSRARLQGKTQGEGSVRAPREATDPAAAARAQRLERALLRLGEGQRDAAMDSLTMLRADALSTNPPLAVALGAALQELRNGSDAAAELERARRLAAGALTSRSGLPRWGGLP